ncbi:hypothetical protein ACIBK9_41645 [Nonomuraea sp. NPDC050227]|uniref:hypothetical protein n=1 Tax=Nonomuraea sp. NPDC050227 TaxID=3364360 RepID=UPI00379F86C6
MHWHAYLWTGNGAERGREAERRPGSPDFPTSPLPPMRTGDWLAKQAARVAATFEVPEPARLPSMPDQPPPRTKAPFSPIAPDV